ncbi:NAD(P)-binding Rossmann-fold superfamily protein [Actinidia rufa]|uniref:NAD(P)-binding Rossmann-fold superfamily protein n=1 Tax=Actinidia rufa TaxID=165716 RepID=A0A7J0F5C9_9ERIC|nr:NAD(P)-binding Rossmann-fold superfamily protein [Actinidia rufa]
MRSMASSASSRSIAAIVGVGPNLGRSIARKFAHEGYTVAILSRDLGIPLFSLSYFLPRPSSFIQLTLTFTGRLSRFADEIAREEKAQVFAIRIDCSDSRSVREAFEGVLSLGFVEVLVYNAYQPFANCQPTNFTDIRVEAFEKSVAISSVGAFLSAQQVLPGMVERGRGTILFTGCSASLNGIAGYSELCCGKFALRALSQCLAREFQPLGVHVAHVIIDGIVGSPRGPSTSSQQRLLTGEHQHQHQQSGGGGHGSMDPDALAQTYWHLHTQDRTAWTQEIDLRPSTLPPRFL